MVAYRQHFNTRATPQNEPIPGTNMTQNNADGYGFAVDDWVRMQRFLILGAEGGTYYVQERVLTKQNAEAVLRCIQADGQRAVANIVAVSQAGRAPKNDPALFALAMAASLGNEATRQAAFSALPLVARTGTHLFHFVHFAEGFRGWGRAMRRAVADWYQQKLPDDLAYQLVKYQQRAGWSHRDLLRLAKPVPADEQHRQLYRWAVGKGMDADMSWCKPIAGHMLASSIQEEGNCDPALIGQYGLTHEMLPTEWLAKSEVWRALLPNMAMTAMIRNLGRMTANGALKPLNAEVDVICERLTARERIQRARLHPLNVLVALRTYAQGHGERGSLSWEPISQIVDALNEAFYLAFDAVEPTNKRHMLALDVSGSMGAMIAGLPLSCREASAAMAMVAARTEPKYLVTAFASGNDAFKFGKGLWRGYDNAITALPFSPRQRLNDVAAATSGLPFGGTDCALPMLYALEKGLDVDAFFVYTDSETWANPEIHPIQALQQYRERTKIPAKLIVVGMTATEFTIADPNDGGMMDVVGFDTAAPTVMADFVRA